jgi:hypothetical protein
MSLRAPQNAGEAKFQYCNYGYDRNKYTSFDDCMKNYKPGVMSEFQTIGGIVICGDGTKALPPFSHCEDVNGVNTMVKVDLSKPSQYCPDCGTHGGSVIPKTPAPAPMLPSGEQAVATNNDNTQKYILYAILGLFAYTILIKK